MFILEHQRTFGNSDTLSKCGTHLRVKSVSPFRYLKPRETADITPIFHGLVWICSISKNDPRQRYLVKHLSLDA